MKRYQFENGVFIDANRFESVKDSICSLFSHENKILIGTFRNSLKILYKKAQNPDFVINDDLYLAETECLKQKQLLKEDNTVEGNVEAIIKYLLGPNELGELELLSKPIYEVETPLITSDSLAGNSVFLL